MNISFASVRIPGARLEIVGSKLRLELWEMA